MTCADFLKELTDYLDSTLDPVVRAELEEHLQWCRNCYVVCNTTQKTIEIYRNNEIYDLPEGLRTRLQTLILAKCRTISKEPDSK